MMRLYGNPEEKQYDVVFLIEASSRLERHFSEMKNLYIKPILSQFNPAFGDEPEATIDNNKNLYTLVTFTSHSSAPSVTVTQPTTRAYEMFDAISLIPFTSNTNSPQNHLTEGLAMSLQVLDDYQNFRNENTENVYNIERHIILVCNSYNYDIPVSTVFSYMNKYLQELINIINQRSISLSIICPRKQPKLLPLYQQVSKLPKPLMNYSHDPKHYVLIHQIKLKEQPRKEKEVAPVIELDRSPKTGSTDPPTQPTTSILVEQIKEAQSQRQQNQPVSTNPPISQQNTQIPTPHTSASILTDILEAPASGAQNLLHGSIGGVSLASSGLSVQTSVSGNMTYNQPAVQTQIRGINPLNPGGQLQPNMVINQAKRLPMGAQQQLASQQQSINIQQPAMSQQNTMMSQNNPMMAQQNPMMSQPNMMSQHSVMSSQQQQQQQQQQQSMMSQQNTIPQTALTTQQQRPMLNQQQNMMQQQGNVAQQQMVQQPGIPQQQLMGNQPNQTMLAGSQQSMMAGQQAQTSILSNQPGQQPMTSQQGQPGMVQRPTGIPAQPSPISQHRIIWEGMIEMKEKQPAPERTISFRANFTVDPQQEQDLVTSGLRGWPPLVSIVGIPEVILNQLLRLPQLIRESRQINIITESSPNSPVWEVIKSLTKRQQVGLITQNNSEFKIMLITVTRPGTSGIPPLRGFLPRQQEAWYEDFKNSINKYKAQARMNAQRMPNPGNPTMQANLQMQGSQIAGNPQMAGNPQIQQMMRGQMNSQTGMPMQGQQAMQMSGGQQGMVNMQQSMSHQPQISGMQQNMSGMMGSQQAAGQIQQMNNPQLLQQQSMMNQNQPRMGMVHHQQMSGGQQQMSGGQQQMMMGSGGHMMQSNMGGPGSNMTAGSNMGGMMPGQQPPGPV